MAQPPGTGIAFPVAEDMTCVERWINDDPRTYTSAQLCRKLKEERQVDLSSSRLRELLQKKTIDGNGPVKATKRSKMP